MATPYVTRVEDRVLSTQNSARRAFESRGDGTPVLVVAKAQDAARGRGGSVWWDCPRPMLASVALAGTLEEATLAPLVAAIAAHDAIEATMAVTTGLKWPNDVVIDTGKVGGILVERSDPTVVVGCGLNVWWPDPPAPAASLLLDDPGWETVVGLARAWAERLISGLVGLPASFDTDSYVELCQTIGRNITWNPDGRGKAVGVGEDGALLVETQSGIRSIRSGEVSHVRSAL